MAMTSTPDSIEASPELTLFVVVALGLKSGALNLALGVRRALSTDVRNRDDRGLGALLDHLKISEVENECCDSEREAHAHNEDNAELDWVGNAPSLGPDHPRLVLLRDPPRLVLHAVPVPGGVRGHPADRVGMRDRRGGRTGARRGIGSLARATEMTELSGTLSPDTSFGEPESGRVKPVLYELAPRPDPGRSVHTDVCIARRRCCARPTPRWSE